MMFGCYFPIGKCFSSLNNTLHLLGTGAYHVGIEVNGLEYAYGSCEEEGLSGVFTCRPKNSPGYEFRQTLDFGDIETKRRSWVSVQVPDEDAAKQNNNNNTKKSPIPTKTVYREFETFIDGHSMMVQMSREYMGNDYDLLRNNCCCFSRDAALRLGVSPKDIPTWFMTLAEAGVATEDVVRDVDQTVMNPIRRMMSVADDDEQGGDRGDGGVCCGEGDYYDPNPNQIQSLESQPLTEGVDRMGFEVVALKKGKSMASPNRSNSRSRAYGRGASNRSRDAFSGIGNGNNSQSSSSQNTPTNGGGRMEIQVLEADDPMAPKNLREVTSWMY